ncbi:hypothetical protein [Novosphingobium umbonatum]|nr:hypothetical protein [Novosphingobium umbonatum]
MTIVFEIWAIALALVLLWNLAGWAARGLHGVGNILQQIGNVLKRDSDTL